MKIIDKNQLKPDIPSFDLKDVVSILASRWYWYVISLIVFITGAWVYLEFQPVIYTRSASLMIKDSQRSDSNVDFSDFGLTGNISNIENEMLMLRSPDCIEEVVRRLTLNDKYTQPKGLRDIELYTDRPYCVQPVDSIVHDNYGFEIKPLTDTTYMVTGFAEYNDGDDIMIKACSGDTINTPVGRFVIMALPMVQKYIGTEISYSHTTAYNEAMALVGRLDIGLGSEKGSVINISFSDASIAKADDVLLTLIDVYNENWLEDRNRVAVSTSRFIDERLDLIEQELGMVDTYISNYKSDNLIPDIQSISSMHLGQSANNMQRINQINDEITTLKTIKDEIGQIDDYELLPLHLGMDDGLRALRDQYNALVLKRNRLTEKGSAKNPAVIQVSETMDVLRSNLIGSINNRLEALNSQLDHVVQLEAVTLSQISATPEQAKFLLSVERQQKVKEALYLFMLQKREENELSQAFTAYNTRLVNKPVGGESPSSPNRSGLFLSALLLAIVLPTSIILPVNIGSTKLRGRRDLEGMQAPLLGEIPQVKGKKKDAYIIVRENSRDVINEAFRSLRTNMEFLYEHGQGNITMITSFNPASGKSFLSINLAKTIAIKGKKVLVIDGDLRHASVSSFVDRPDDGLCSFLIKRSDDLMSLLVSDAEHPELKILPVGPLPPNPTELLAGRRFGEALDSLRQEFDYIFIDCPPIEVVTDTRIISRYVDRTIFVLRVGVLERCMLSELEALYANNTYPGIAMIINGTTTNRRHGYRYGYHYGYTQDYQYGPVKD